MGLDRHGRVSTYGLGPSARDAFNKSSRMLDLEMIRDELRDELLMEMREEMQEELREEMRELVREEMQEELQAELQVIREEFAWMKAQIETMRTCMEKAGLMPSSSGQVLDVSSARQEQSNSSSQQHPVPALAPLQGSTDSE